MGNDWLLVQDALIIGFFATCSGAALAFLYQRRKKAKAAGPTSKSGSLEKRVEVLERIATDRSLDLADQIETLRYSQERN